MKRPLSRLLSAFRRAYSALRSAALRHYIQLAFPGVRCARGVEFGRDVTVRAFDGGVMAIGPGVSIRDSALIMVDGGRLTIERDCLIGRGATIVCVEELTIGAGTLLAEHVTIRDQDHEHGGEGRLDDMGRRSAPIVIGHDVWLAAKVTVTRGVSIAPHTVVGANAVVTRTIAERGVYVGVPARRLK